MVAALLVLGCASRPPSPDGGSARLLSVEDTRALARAYRDGLGAYYRQPQDLAGASAGFSRALALNPGADSLLYTLAQVAAEAGRPEEAFGWLEKLAAGETTLVPQAQDFPGLGGERFTRIVEAISAKAPSSHAAIAFTLGERDLIPEGIAHDPGPDRFLVGSIRKRKVVSVRRDGTASDLVRPVASGIRSPLGMTVDAQRRRLWVATNAAPTSEGFAESDRGRSELVQVNADSGALVARFPRHTPGRHLLNDVAVNALGDVYVTDSEAGEVLRLKQTVAPGTDGFEVVVPAGELFYPNGLALGPDGTQLFVADAVQGITRVELATGERAPLRHAAGVTTRDIDGMYWWADGLVAVQNGTGAGRVGRFILSPDRSEVARFEVLEVNHPSFLIPTTGAIAGDALYVIADSQIRSFDAEGRIFPPERLRPIDVIRVPLRR